MFGGVTKVGDVVASEPECVSFSAFVQFVSEDLSIFLSLLPSPSQMGRFTAGPLVWSCLRQHAVSHKRVLFSTASPLMKSPRKPRRSPPIQVVHHEYQQQQQQQQRLAKEHVTTDSQELVPLPDQETAVETAPKVNVPLRVIPRAQITPNLRLTPKERLHIEQLTRVTPRPSAPPGTVETEGTHRRG